MSSYVKFLKDILSNKRKLEEYKTVALTEECNAILQKKLPPKLKDPGSFTIPCSIENSIFEKALCDLGASINLMPLSIFKKLGLGEAKPTTVILQLADRSLKHPRGIIEDVLVKVGKFIFPADFIILDMEEDNDRFSRQWSHFSNKNSRLLQLWGMFHGYYSSTCRYQAERYTTGHSLAYKSQRKTMNERGAETLERERDRRKKTEKVKRKEEKTGGREQTERRSGIEEKKRRRQ
ncbi:uncharacterized protein LOC133701499 [Populus nigra]|uniref:uncharacterized protein LOC133701499 n=1 Tax=Populus nigra TaxID=3691 RepID=UPI002B26B643|nr:uncharacterized protein LOC133701499 [Populus nigra]